MKKIYLLTAISILFVFKITNAQVGIGTTVPDASAALDITSYSKGFLVPRVTTEQRTTAILFPADGLLVYDISTKTFWYYKSGPGWTEVGTAQPQVGFNSYLTSDQTLPNYTFTSLAPYTKLFDYSNSFNAATGVFTAPQSGLYHFNISVEVGINSANIIYAVQCSQNGVPLTGGQKTALVPSLSAPFPVSVNFIFDVQLTAGDTFSYQFLQRTGADTTVYGSSSTETTTFSGYKVF